LKKRFHSDTVGEDAVLFYISMPTTEGVSPSLFDLQFIYPIVVSMAETKVGLPS
jgi:hypothetical protein